MNAVSVFRTSVSNEAEVSKLKPLLDSLLSNGERWNFDLEDRENILRVAGAHCDPKPVIKLLQSTGYQCEELED